MKNWFSATAFAMILLGALTLTSCGKEEISSNIEGTWNATSYQVANIEQIGVTFTSRTISFGAPSNNTGTYSIQSETVAGEATTSGTYTIDEDDKTLTFDGTTFDADFDDDSATLEGPTVIGISSESYILEKQ